VAEGLGSSEACPFLAAPAGKRCAAAQTGLSLARELSEGHR